MPRVSAFGGLDGDGRVEIVSDTGAILLDRGGGRFEVLGTFDGITAPASLTDLDGDGILDLVSAGFPYGLVEIRYGRCR